MVEDCGWCGGIFGVLVGLEVGEIGIEYFEIGCVVD